MRELTGPTAPLLISGQGEGRTSLVAILWRGRWLVTLGVVACLGIAGAYLVKAERIYQATARLLVIQNGGRPLRVVNNEPSQIIEGADDSIPTHAMVIRSPMVVGRAIESIGLENLPALVAAAKKKSRRPVQVAIEDLTITRPDRQAKILQIDYRSPSRVEALRMVRAITESYRQFLEDVYQRNNSEVVALITKARDELGRELNDLEGKYLEFRKKKPVLTGDGSGRPFINRRIDEWDRASNEAMVKSVQLKAKLELGQKLAREGSGLWSIAFAMEQMGGVASGLNPGILAQQAATPPSDYIRQLNQEQQRLAERFGPENTRAKEIQEQITHIQDQSRDSRHRLEKAEIADLLGSIKQSLESIQTMRAEVKSQFDRDLDDAKAAEIDLLTESNLRGGVDRQRALFNTVVDQLKQARLAGDFNSIRAETIEPADVLPKAVRPITSLTLALALVTGLMLGAGAAVVSDLLDPRIRSLAEMRRVLQLPLLGQLPALPADGARLMGPVGLLCHATPRSQAAEAYKVARANIDLFRRNLGVRVLLVTGTNPGDGTSAVASNLAISLAQAGRGVLLVDANLRRPSLHEVHGLQRERGLVQVLEDLLPINRVAQPSPVKNLDVITSGPEVTNPAELLSSPRMHEFLEDARRDYDTVIIDSPSLLAVADPSIIGALADGILMVVHATGTKREEAARSLEILRALGTPILGALVNGTSPGTHAALPTAPEADWRGHRMQEIRSDIQLTFTADGIPPSPSPAGVRSIPMRQATIESER